MTLLAKTKTILRYFGIGLLFPALLLVNAFLIPEPYSHPLIHVALAPTKLMPFLDNNELMHELTVVIFGRITPNYAPITILFLIAFWFLIGLACFFAFSRLRSRKEA
jgi:hypothetical protein